MTRLIFAMACLGIPTLATAAPVAAASCALTDVAAAIALAPAGGNVTLPACSVTWAAPLSIGKQVALIGAGAAVTVIKAQTSNSNGYLLSAPPIEIANVTIDGNHAIGCVSLSANVPTQGVKVHDNVFTNCGNRAVHGNGLAYGVVYSNQFIDNQIDVDTGGVESAGWNAPAAYGDGNNLFFEDNAFRHPTDAQGMILYNSQGGRMVFRHNASSGYIDYDIADNHGNVGPLPNRGTVIAEVYDNTWDFLVGSQSYLRAYFHRGGRLLYYNNRITTPGGSGFEMSEEDGWQTAFGCPCPILDKVTDTHIWNNTINGQPLGVSFNHDPPDSANLKLGVDFFFTAPVGYLPYAYPHPARSAPTTTCPQATLAAADALTPLTLAWCSADTDVVGANLYGIGLSAVTLTSVAKSAGPFGDGLVQYRGSAPPQRAGTYTVTLRQVNIDATGIRQESDPINASDPFVLVIKAVKGKPGKPSRFVVGK